MLLNTAVSSQVHELLGGVVEHRGIDHTDLPDDIKLLQRLYSLNVMRLEVREPDVQLWTEPGTVMHTLQLSFPPVAALQHLPGGGRLYFTPQVTPQLWDRLVQALELLYVKDAPSSSSDHAAAAQPTAAEAGKRRVQAAAEAASPGTTPKRTRGTAQQQPVEVSLVEQLRGKKQQQGTFSITLLDQLGDKLRFKVCPSTKVGAVLQAYADWKGRNVDELKFIFDGENYVPSQTLAEIEMSDGDVADCLVRQSGC